MCFLNAFLIISLIVFIFLEVKLLQAHDSFKDQTFFLCQAPQSALQKAMFPIGTYLKRQVKDLAKEAGLDSIACKKESTGICFIGKRNFQEFISDVSLISRPVEKLKKFK